MQLLNRKFAYDLGRNHPLETSTASSNIHFWHNFKSKKWGCNELFPLVFAGCLRLRFHGYCEVEFVVWNMGCFDGCSAQMIVVWAVVSGSFCYWFSSVYWLFLVDFLAGFCWSSKVVLTIFFGIVLRWGELVFGWFSWLFFSSLLLILGLCLSWFLW